MTPANPTKWPDRIIEFGKSATKAGFVIAAATALFSFGAAFAGSIATAGVATASSYAALFCAGVIGCAAFCFAGNHKLETGRPAWRRLGTAVPLIAALAAGYTAQNNAAAAHTEKSRPNSVTTAFNAPAESSSPPESRMLPSNRQKPVALNMA